MIRPRKPDISLAEAVTAALSSYVSPIIARSVVGLAARRAGQRVEGLELSGLNPELLEEIVRGLRMYVREPAQLADCRRILEELSSGAPSSGPSGFEMTISREQDIVAARNNVRELARSVGFCHTDQIRIATAVSEVSRNIYNYAGKGLLAASPVLGERRGVRIRASDNGPGIPNIDAILRGGYISKTGMGLGLVGCRQLMDEFRVVTAPGRGTHITMEKYT